MYNEETITKITPDFSLDVRVTISIILHRMQMTTKTTNVLQDSIKSGFTFLVLGEKYSQYLFRLSRYNSLNLEFCSYSEIHHP